MEEPVVRESCWQEPGCTISGVGQVYNVNSLLGKNGIIGIKLAATIKTLARLWAPLPSSKRQSNHSLNGDYGRAIVSPGIGRLKQFTGCCRTTVADTVIVRKGDVLATTNLPAGGRVRAIAAADLHHTAAG